MTDDDTINRLRVKAIGDIPGLNDIYERVIEYEPDDEWRFTEND